MKTKKMDFKKVFNLKSDKLVVQIQIISKTQIDKFQISQIANH